MNRYAAKGINVSCRTIDGDAFIFREDTRDLLKLDRVGSFIWDQINGRRTISQISEICCNTLDGDREEIVSGVAEFVATLTSRGVAVVSDDPFEGVMVSAC